MRRLALLFALLPGLCAGAEALSQVPDWAKPGDPLYTLLEEAVQAGAVQSLLAAELRARRPLPIASARELGLEALDSGALPAELEARLRAALPPENEIRREGMIAAAAELSATARNLEALRSGIADASKRLKGSTYDKASLPSLSFSLGGSLDSERWVGIPSRQQSSPRSEAALTFSGSLSKLSYSFDMIFSQGGTSQSLSDWHVLGGTLSFGEGALSGTELGLGARAYTQLSPLIYSAPPRPGRLSFFDRAAAPDPYQYGPSGSERTTEGLRLVKQGAARFWPFHSSTLILTTPEQYYQGWNTRRVSELAARIDIAEWSTFGFDQLRPYGVFMGEGNDAAELLSYGVAGVPEEAGQAWAAGFESQLAGGGSLALEFASSRWRRADLSALGQSYEGQALVVNASKQWGALGLAADFSQISPRFVTEQQMGFYTNNWQAGSYLDSTVQDPRPGKAGQAAWQTLSRDPRLLVNNSQRMGGRLEFRHGYGFASLGAWTSGQIEASGPWLQSAHWVGGHGQNFADWYSLFYNGFAAPPAPGLAAPPTAEARPLWAYNKFTEGAASYRGNSYLANWNELTQKVFLNNQETLLLSQNGLGDANIREESRKWLNSALATLNFDLRSLFDREHAGDLTSNLELRDTDEAAGLPAWDSGHLLAQLISETSLRWGLFRQVDLVALYMHEQWLSNAGFFPLHYTDTLWGAGLDFRLDEYLSGLSADLRWHELRHDDEYFGGRSFHGWGLGFSTRLTY